MIGWGMVFSIAIGITIANIVRGFVKMVITVLAND